jgi:hypothetical protein
MPDPFLGNGSKQVPAATIRRATLGNGVLLRCPCRGVRSKLLKFVTWQRPMQTLQAGEDLAYSDL